MKQGRKKYYLQIQQVQTKQLCNKGNNRIIYLLKGFVCTKCNHVQYIFIMTLILYAIIGIFAGFIGGLLGVGGGLVVVPALIFMFQYLDFPLTYAMQVAVGTSLGAMVFTAASSAWAHYTQKGVYWHLFRVLAPGIILGAILGAVIADYISTASLKMIFGVFAILIGIYFLFSQEFKESRTKLAPHLILWIIIGVIIGSISSILGIGGGIMTVPILTAFGVPIRNAISTSAATGFLIALIGAISFLYLGMHQDTFSGSIGYLYLPAFISIGITSSLMAPYGAKLAYKFPTKILKRIFGIFLIATGIGMV